MKKFLKPTWKKIILAVVILFIFFLLLYYESSLYSCPLTDLKLPIGNEPPPTPTPIPSILDVTGKVTITAVGLLVSPCPVYWEYADTAGPITLFFLASISYVLSCTFVFLLGKLRGKTTPYSAKPKK